MVVNYERNLYYGIMDIISNGKIFFYLYDKCVDC